MNQHKIMLVQAYLDRGVDVVPVTEPGEGSLDYYSMVEQMIGQAWEASS